MKIIPAIWLTFAILFSYFSIYHFVQLTRSFPQFEWTASDENGVDFYSPSANETRNNVVSFIGQWNKYIEKENATSFWINLIAALSYLFTAIMAFVSTILPGPFNIIDTKNYVYSQWAKAKTYIKSLRKTEDETKENGKNAHQVTKESDEQNKTYIV